MIRADTGSQQLYERPVGQPVVLGFARSSAWQNPAQFQSGCDLGLQVGFCHLDKTHNLTVIIDVLRA
ncbi:MAG: hypothetical protein WB421_17955 [Terriglobales bacterium]